MLRKWNTENWYWSCDCKITPWSIVIEIYIAKSYPQNWPWYWYCKKKMPKILQHFIKSYEVNIATILRLNHKYWMQISIETTFEDDFIFADIDIEIELAKIFFEYRYWNWYCKSISLLLDLKLRLRKFQLRIEWKTISKYLILHIPDCIHLSVVPASVEIPFYCCNPIISYYTQAYFLANSLTTQESGYRNIRKIEFFNFSSVFYSKTLDFLRILLVFSAKSWVCVVMALSCYRQLSCHFQFHY